MKERNYNIDLIRIISMIFIIFLHILGKGGVTLATESFSVNYEACWILEFISLCGVNLFALISGYVGINAKSYKYSNIIALWLRVLMYSAGITVILKFVMPDAVGLKDLAFSFLPVLKNRYWYFTAYVGLFVLMPLLNKGINSLEKKQATLLVYGMLFFFSIFSSVSDGLKLAKGYSAIWLIIMYIAGAYFGKYNTFEKIKKRYLALGFIICTGISVVLENISNANLSNDFESNHILNLIAKVIDKGVGQLKLFSFTLPTVVLASILLFALLLKINIHKPTKIIVGFLAPMTFSVYLIHTNMIVYEKVIADKFAVFADYNVLKMVLCLVLTAIIIFAVCSGIDYVRYLVFEKLLNVKGRLYKIETKIFNKLGY